MSLSKRMVALLKTWISSARVVHRFIQKHALLKQNTTVIVGLSGGPDSVCLLTLLKKLQPTYNLKIIAAHLDHQWRTISHEDVSFVNT